MDRSPFRSILGTNYVPTERECGVIAEFLIVPQTQLAELQAKVAEQEAMLQKLKERCGDLQGDIKAHRAIISLIRRLPDDILREIFLHCLPFDRNAEMSAAEPPLLLAHVCGRWRRVALSTPRLWSSFHIWSQPDEDVFDNELESQDDLILQWIGRGGNTPLSLSFSTPQMQGPRREDLPNTVDMGRLFSLLSPSFSRLKKLEVSLDGFKDDIHDIAKLQDEEGRTPFSSVEQLSLRVVLRHEEWLLLGEHQGELETLLGELGLKHNMRLRKLGLYFQYTTKLHTETSWLTQIIPCNQLEVLDLQGLDPPHRGSKISILALPSVLQACPKLVVFKANVLFPYSPPTPSGSTSRVALNGLKEVSLFFPHWEDVRALDFIARCDWPSLTSLYLRAGEGEGEGSASGINILSHMVDRFCSTLTSLRLSSYVVTPQRLTDLMFALPKLVQLHLEHPGLSKYNGLGGRFDIYDQYFEEDGFDDVLAHLIPKPDGTPYALPLLRFLKWERNTDFSDKALAHVLQQRATSPYLLVPLKQVHIVFGRTMEDDIYPMCSDLIDAGLDLRLMYPPSIEGFTEDSAYWKMAPLQPLDVDYRTLGWESEFIHIS